jgi:hypothetical protein
MVNTMKAHLALAFLGLTLFAAHPELTQVTRVYLLPMGSAFDQYLANRLTAMRVFEVVTDPQMADAIFTDRLGEAFQEQFLELYPPPPPPQEKKEVKEETKKKESAKEESPKDPELKGDVRVVRSSAFSRGKGNVFLVSRKSRAVIWSIHQQPKYTSAEALDRNAEIVVKRLKDDLAGK